MTKISLYTATAIQLTIATLKADPLLDISYDKNGEQSGHLNLAAEAADHAMEPVAVTPLRKYKLSITAAIDSDDTIEGNDRIPEIIAANGGRSFARCKLEFFDKEGNETTFLLYGRSIVRTQSIHFVSREMQSYVTVFYAPPQAETLRLTLVPQNRRLMIKKLVLEPESSEGSVNCNPDFRYGTLNLSGWNPDTEGRLYRRPDGTTVLKCGTRGGSSMFAVDDQARYSFFCKGEGYSSTDGKVTVSFYDIDGNELGYTHLFWDKDMNDGATKSDIQPLAGSKLAMLKASHVILQEVKVTKE